MRVLSRRAGLEGKTDADFAMSEMLLQETEDLYTATAKAMYAPGYPASRPAAFAALFAPDGAANKHLGNLEALVNASGAFTSAPTAGQISVVAALHLLGGLEPLDAARFPKLRPSTQRAVLLRIRYSRGSSPIGAAPPRRPRIDRPAVGGWRDERRHERGGLSAAESQSTWGKVAEDSKSASSNWGVVLRSS